MDSALAHYHAERLRFLVDLLYESAIGKSLLTPEEVRQLIKGRLISIVLDVIQEGTNT